MASLYILLVLPALVLARIDVQLSGEFQDDKTNNLKVYYSGSEVGIISATEEKSFGVTAGKLKDSVRSYFGKRPDDVYLKSPTPWGDLYKSYGWDQVQRTLLPVRGKVLDISFKPTIVMKQVFQNNSTKPATFDVGISQTVQNTVKSSWTRGESLSINQEVYYGFDIEVVKGGTKTSLSYTASWSTNVEKSETITVGAKAGMKVLLQPGQAVEAQLFANRGTVTMEVEYEASLSGICAVNYANGYKGHHFWALDIGAIMASGGLSNRIVHKEVIELGFYTQSRVLVNDKRSGIDLMNVAF